MAPKKESKGQLAFKVRPQVPSQPEFPPQMQSVFRGPLACQLNVRFKSTGDANDGGERKRSSGVPAKPVQFAANKTTTGFTERREKHDRPPPKKRKTVKYPRADFEPTLTTRRPITTDVPNDAWALIFKRCNPKFLIQARLVCRDFHDILNQQSIWREARRHTYGSIVPECPVDLSESHYANLLVGRGCQVKPCTQRLTRKVYWPFMLRICEQCFSEVTRLPEAESAEARMYANFYNQLELEVQQTIPNNLSGLIPACSMWAGRFSQIRALDRTQQMWKDETDLTNYCVMTKDYDVLRQEFGQKVMTEPSYFLFWTRLRWSKTKGRIQIAKDLDGVDQELLDRPLAFRDDKAAFFQVMAFKELHPPMTYQVLKRMAAYHKAVETPNAASKRAWDLLAAKIHVPQVRTQAEQLIKWEREDCMWRISTQDGLYDQLAKHRSRPSSLSFSLARCTEQEIVFELASEVLVDLLDVVHDYDVLLLLLQKVRRFYEALDQKPHGLNGDGASGEYRLLLDDARMIANDVLLPQANERGAVRAKRLTCSLRCIACTRTDCHKTYTFENLMIHVRNVHSNRVGKDMHYYKLAIPTQSRIRRYTDPIAWYHIAWPKSFPALPFHRRATAGMVWNPEVEDVYIEHNVDAGANIFANFNVIGDDTIPTDDFTANFSKAVTMMIDTRLDSACIIKIGMEYAMMRHCGGEIYHSPTHTSITQLQSLEKAVRAISSKVEFKFKCGVCVKDPISSSRGRQMRETLHPQTLTILMTHWQSKHNFGVDTVVVDLITLPSDFDVHQIMTREDAKLDALRARAEMVNKKLTSSTSETNETTRDPRAWALLEIPSIQSRFDQLFEHREDGDAMIRPRASSLEDGYLSEEVVNE